jgi:hypothetical protein
VGPTAVLDAVVKKKFPAVVLSLKKKKLYCDLYLNFFITVVLKAQLSLLSQLINFS